VIKGEVMIGTSGRFSFRSLALARAFLPRTRDKTGDQRQEAAPLQAIERVPMRSAPPRVTTVPLPGATRRRLHRGR